MSVFPRYGLFRKHFRAIYEQYSGRHGEAFSFLRDVDRSEIDEEVGPMYWIKFHSDGVEIMAWPEEVCRDARRPIGWVRPTLGIK